MENIVFEQIEMGIRELLIRLEEARNLLYNGRIIPCDRKLQGAQVKADAILGYVIQNQNASGDSNGVMVNTSPQG